MRKTAGFLVLLALGSAMLAYADDPAPTTTDAPATAVSPAPAVAPANAAPAPAGSKESAKAASIIVTADPTELTPEEKGLLSRGYKLEIRHGEKVFCHREQEIGSRFETKTCNTSLALRQQREFAQEQQRLIQANRPQANN